MKPAPFDYYAPASLGEALELLASLGEEAKLLAGGQSLVPSLNMRLSQPGALVDLGGVGELAGVRSNGRLALGATTRQTVVLQSPEVAAFAPIIPAALRYVAHAAIRNRGTFGGSVAHADPAAELPAVLLALDAELVVAGPDGERVIPADEFFVTLFTTALNADEILTEIRFPRPAADAAWAFSEIAPRHGDFALAGSAVVVRLDGDGVVSSARVALFGVGERAVRATEAEEFLAGKRLGDADVAREAGRIAASSLDPPSDLHASGRYRKDVAAVLVKRGLLEAAAR